MINIVRSFAAASICCTAIAQTTHTVELSGLQFIPQNLTIQIGDTVRWVWVSGFHNVESGIIDNGQGIADGNFFSGTPTAAVGTTFDVVFDQSFLDARPMPGNIYPYYCVVHTTVDMKGTVTVVAGGCTIDDDCDDADACNGQERCVQQSCEEGTPPECNDDNPCTDDGCDAAIGCTNISNDANSCDDGDPCTDQDGCTAGSCAGQIVVGCCHSDSDCQNTNPCTTDFCDATNTCVQINNNLACDDGDLCTRNDVCLNGMCTGEVITDCCFANADCDDDNECTEDRCVGNQCTQETLEDCCTLDSECDDGDECTSDACIETACSFSPIANCNPAGAPLPLDDDGDGVMNADDRCTGTPDGLEVDDQGCSCDQRDSDDDGVNDCDDACPDSEGATGTQGCSDAQVDSDADGVSDANEACPETEQDLSVDDIGCALVEPDSPNDGDEAAGQSVEPGIASPPVRICGLLGGVLWLPAIVAYVSLHLRGRCSKRGFQ